MELHGDVESGPISKMERTLFVANNILFRQRNLRGLLAAWVIFVAYAFDAHTNLYHVVTSAVPNGTQALTNLHELVQNATDLFEETPAQQYQRVLDDPDSYRAQVSTSYEFASRMRHEVALSKITTTLRAVQDEREFACLAAIHVGIPKRVMTIGEAVYVNPAIDRRNNADQIQSTEESAFSPGKITTATRDSEILLRYQTDAGSWTSAILKQLDSVCAQHCLEAMGHG